LQLTYFETLEATAPSLAMLGRRNAQQWSRRDNLDRLAYRLSNVMVSGPWHKFTCIMLANIILIFLGGCLLRLVGGASTWDSALFKSYALLIAAPGADSVNEATWINSTAANLLFLCGIFTFATVLGIITSSIEAHVEWVLEANHRVVEKDHTVILNWSERLLPVLRQLAVARAANGYKALPVVIMADKNVGEMRELVRAGLGSLNLPVTVRQGSGTTVEDLEKVPLHVQMCACKHASYNCTCVHIHHVHVRVSVRVSARACVRASVRACVRVVCVHGCVCVCVCPRT